MTQKIMEWRGVIFKKYSIGMRIIFHAVIENYPQILKSKIDAIQSSIRMLGTNPIECYQ